MLLIRFIVILLIPLILQGCVDVAVTGAQAAYNHDRIQKTLGDHYISTQAYRKLYRDTDEFDDTSVAVSTFHRTVLLTGQVSSVKEGQKIAQIVKDIPDVEKVYNLTQVGIPISSIIQ